LEAVVRKPDDPAGSLASVGEFGLIAAMASRFPPVSLATVGIGDDAAVLATPAGNVVAAVDFLLEGRHFRRDWSAPFDVGVKAAARSLADIAAMGAASTALLVALALPDSLPSSWALEFASGLAAECDRAGAGVAGGDTAEASSVIVSVTALGSLPEGAGAVRRSGARPGDVVAVAGPLGHAAAGLALLTAGMPGHPGLVEAQLRPRPPYAAGPQAAACGATAMIDTSDGLLADLGHVADASGIAIDLTRASLGPDDQLAAAAIDISSLTVPSPVPDQLARSWVLTGGEDHSLAATFPAGARLPAGWRVIGSARAGSGVTVDGAVAAELRGWEHFRR
jgi:thiamine-monophosphate kinase